MRATDGSGDARGRVGLELESGSVGRSGATLTGGPHLAARQKRRGGRGPDWAVETNGPARIWALGKKKKKNEEGLGRAENEREGKELVFHF